MGYPRIYYDNRLADATPVADSTAFGFDVLNLADFRPYTWWQPMSIPATVTVDSASVKDVNYWGLYGHNLSSVAVTVQLRGSTDNFVSSDVLVDSYTPTTNAAFIRTVATTSYRYWRLRFVGASTPSVAIACMGVSLTMPSYLDAGFDPTMRNPEGIFNRAVKGHPLGRTIEYEEWATSLRFDLVTWSWLRATWVPAWKAHLRDNPFLFAWDLDSYPAELFLLVAKDKYTSPHKHGQFADLLFDVVGVVPEETETLPAKVPFVQHPYRIWSQWQTAPWSASGRRTTKPL